MSKNETRRDGCRGRASEHVLAGTLNSFEHNIPSSDFQGFVARFVERRYSVSPTIAALIAQHAGLGGSGA